MKRRALWILLILAVLFLALPVINLIVGIPPNSLTRMETDDPVVRKAAGILGRKCFNCHTDETVLPFYAKIPPARGLIRRDIETGRRYFNLKNAFLPGNGTATPEPVLARIEDVLQSGSMPPLRYQMLHWDAGLTSSDREALRSWIRKVREENYRTEDVAEEFRYEVVQPLPRTVKVDPVKVELGRELYHDTRLSGDNTISCASCHELDKGGTDRLRFSKGIRGQIGTINAPTTYNSGFQFKQFWDGRAPTLEEQAKGPVENPVEMGAAWPDVVAKLKEDGEFVRRFTEAYPDGVNVENIVHAIAEFERSLVTPDSRFDLYLRGQDDAISAEEKEGYRLFKKTGCAGCHAGKLLGGQSFEVMGLSKDYFADRGGEITESDLGRYNVTKKESDRHKFKVPTLRNVTLTYPYFHDGSRDDLAEAVRIMAEYQNGRELSDDEVDRIVAFLGTLTGAYQGKPLE